MKDANGDKVLVDRKELQEIYNEVAPLISYIDNVERSVTTTREEYNHLPAKYNQIRLLLGFTKANYDVEMVRSMMGAITGVQ